jgi:hypothetical protein
MEVCKELGIGLLWNVGGEKVQSSSTLVSTAKYAKNDHHDGIVF